MGASLAMTSGNQQVTEASEVSRAGEGYRYEYEWYTNAPHTASRWALLDDDKVRENPGVFSLRDAPSQIKFREAGWGLDIPVEGIP